MIKALYYTPTLFHSHKDLAENTQPATIDRAIFENALEHVNHFRAKELRDRVSKIPPQQASKFFTEMAQSDCKKLLFLMQNYMDCLDENSLCEFLGLADHKNYLNHFAALGEVAIPPFITETYKQFFYDVSREIQELFHRIIYILSSLANVTNGALQPSYNKDPYSFKPPESPQLLTRDAAKEILTTLSAVYLLPKILNEFYTKYVPYYHLPTPLTFISTLFILLLPGIHKRYLQKCPQEHPNVRNLTEEALQKRKQPIFPRKDLLMEIIQKLDTDKGVILVGKHGSGKTELVKSLVWYLLERSSDQTLHGCQVFSCKANKLGTESYLGDTLGQIEDFFRLYSDQLVLFIDEIHQIFEPPKQKTYSMSAATGPQKLLTFKNDFPYVIAATTTDEYNDHIRDNQTDAFKRRFHVIMVPEMSKSELETALIFVIKQSYPNLLLGKDVIPHIIEKSRDYNPDTARVDAVMGLMKEAVRKATIVPFEKDEAELEKLEVQKTNMGTLLARELTHDPARLKTFNRLNNAYLEKKKILDDKMLRAQNINQWTKIIRNLQKKSYIFAGQGKKRLWLESRTLMNFVEKIVDQEKAHFDLETRLTKSVINKITESCQASRLALDAASRAKSPELH